MSYLNAIHAFSCYLGRIPNRKAFNSFFLHNLRNFTNPSSLRFSHLSEISSIQGKEQTPSSDKPSPVISLSPMSKCVSVFPHKCNNWSSPLSTSEVELQFRDFKFWIWGRFSMLNILQVTLVSSIYKVSRLSPQRESNWKSPWSVSSKANEQSSFSTFSRELVQLTRPSPVRGVKLRFSSVRVDPQMRIICSSP